MTTSIRKWYPGASYHVTTRGNHKEDIFRDNKDFAYYLTLIKERISSFETTIFFRPRGDFFYQK